MPRSSWLNILILLLVIIAASYVAQLLFAFLSGFSDIILIVVLAWLVAYALSPLVDGLRDRRVAPRVVNAFGGPNVGLGKQLFRFRVSRPLAVGLVYLGLLIVVVVVIGSFIPAIVAQLNTIVPQLSNVDALETALTNTFQETITRLNMGLNIRVAIDSAFVSLQAYATPILQNTVAILTSVLSLLGNALLVILLSFFFALDGPRFTTMLFDAMPGRLHQETRMFLITTDRAFGGFLRAQLLQAVLIGMATGLILAIFGIQAALLSSLFAALFMLIPLVGPILALLPPLLAVLLSHPGSIVWVMVPLILIQILVLNVIMPRVVGNALGLHPLVIIVSLLIGVKIAGFWGAFFAMPLAGIISAFGAFLIRRRTRLAELTSAIVHEDASDSSLPLETPPLAEPPEPPSSSPLTKKESRA